jgi:hypothetical protein
MSGMDPHGLVGAVNVASVYTTITLPLSPPTGALAVVTDDPFGAVLAYWDGTNWRRSTDKTIIV